MTTRTYTATNLGELNSLVSQLGLDLGPQITVYCDSYAGVHITETRDPLTGEIAIEISGLPVEDAA